MNTQKEKKFVDMTEEEFDKRFNIPQNENGDEVRYETYGEELEAFNALATEKPNNVWTAVDGDNGELLFVNRIAFVNRIYYFATEESYDPNEDIVVDLSQNFD